MASNNDLQWRQPYNDYAHQHQPLSPSTSYRSNTSPPATPRNEYRPQARPLTAGGNPYSGSPPPPLAQYPPARFRTTSSAGRSQPPYHPAPTHAYSDPAVAQSGYIYPSGPGPSTPRPTASPAPYQSPRADVPQSYYAPVPNDQNGFNGRPPGAMPPRHSHTDATRPPLQPWDPYRSEGYRPPPNWNSAPAVPPPPLPAKEQVEYSVEPIPAALRPPLPPKISVSASDSALYVHEGYPQPVGPQSTGDIPGAAAAAAPTVDEELDRALRMSMASYAVEAQRVHTPRPEEDEERALRESAEMYAKQQEMERMAAAGEMDEEQLLAKIYALSMEEAVKEQQQIERAIRRGSRDAGPSTSYGEASQGPSRPQVSLSGASSSTPSRAPSQRTARTLPTVPMLQTAEPSSPTGTAESWVDPSLPRYDDVVRTPSPANPPARLSPSPSPGLTSLSTASPASPLSGLGSTISQQASAIVASPMELSPGAPLPLSPSHQPLPTTPEEEDSNRRRASSYAGDTHTRPATLSPGLGRSPSSPTPGAILRGSFEHGRPSSEIRPSVSQVQLADRPHTVFQDVPPVPPVPPMPMPMPSPVPFVHPNSDAAPGPSSQAASNPYVSGERNRRINIEDEYADGVSFGYTPPVLDQPVVPRPPPFPEVITMIPNEAFHIAARTWHDLLRLLARLGAVAIQPLPAAFSLLPANASVLGLRVILHFHKCKYGGNWRTVLWLDFERALPPSMTAVEQDRWNNGDTTMLPWDCRIPEEAIGGGLRGPTAVDVSNTMTDIVYVLQKPFPRLPTTLSNLATVLNDAFHLSKNAVSTGTGPGSASDYMYPPVDRGLSLKRLHKAIEKVYPPNKRGATSLVTGVLKRPGSVGSGDGKKVAVGGKRSMFGKLRHGMEVMVGKEEKGGQWNNEGELCDLVTPFQLPSDHH